MIKKNQNFNQRWAISFSFLSQLSQNLKKIKKNSMRVHIKATKLQQNYLFVIFLNFYVLIMSYYQFLVINKVTQKEYPSTKKSNKKKKKPKHWKASSTNRYFFLLKIKAKNQKPNLPPFKKNKKQKKMASTKNLLKPVTLG